MEETLSHTIRNDSLRFLIFLKTLKVVIFSIEYRDRENEFFIPF